MISPGLSFFYTNEVDYDTVTRSKNWFRYVPTWELLKQLPKSGGNNMAGLAVVFHMRLTRPVLGMLLVFMGLSIILRDQNRNVFISTGLCLGLCALFFIMVFFCKHLGENESLPPALAAWFPVILFGLLSFVMFDAVHT